MKTKVIDRQHEYFNDLKDLCDFDIPNSHVKHSKSMVIPYAQTEDAFYRLSESIEWCSTYGLDWSNAPMNIAWINQPKVPDLTETQCQFIRRLADFFEGYGEDEVIHCFKVGEYNQVDAVKCNFDSVAAILRHENPFK